MDTYDDPRWVRVLAFGMAAAVAAYGSVGLLLAVLGTYRRSFVFVAGTAVLVGLCFAALPLLPRQGEVSRAAHIGAVLAVAAVVAITVWNVSNASQQVLVIRDGGTYLDAGKWISAHGTLEVKPFVGPFSTTSGLAASSAGLSRSGAHRTGDHLDFNLEHMLPVLLAEGQGLGGDRLMFATVALLGGAALLAFYLFARRVLRHPLAAFGAMLCLGLLMPQVSFSRDSTTEIPMQVLLLTAAWLLCDRRTLQHRGTAFTVGLFVGLLQAIHIDGLAFAMGLPFVGLGWWLRAAPTERRRVGWALGFAGIGVAVGVGLGFLDLMLRSAHYFQTLRHDVIRLSAAAVLATAAAAALGVLARVWSRREEAVRARWQRVQQPAAYAASALVLLGGFGAWLVRPHLQTVRARGADSVVALVQRATHLPLDPTRRYFEHAVGWAAWYVGPLTLTIAFVGAAYAVYTFVRGSLRAPAQVAMLVLGPPALLYLWRPSITPDQIWAMRRFVPAVFPVLVLAAFGALCVLAGRSEGVSGSGPSRARRVVAIALGVAAVAYPVYTIRNVSQLTQQRGFPAVVQDACRIVGKRGAVVVPQESAPRTWLYDPQTLRSFCDVPVGIMLSGQGSTLAPHLPSGKLSATVLRTLAQQWAQQNRQLYIVAGSAATIRKLFPGIAVKMTRGHTNAHLLAQTLVSRPAKYQLEHLQFAIARVPT